MMRHVRVNAFERVKGFLSVAYRHFNDTGAVFPSSLQASRHIARLVPPKNATVFEYGPGEGVVSRALLEHLDENSRIFAVEKLRDFIPKLKKIVDPRLHVIEGSAIDLSKNIEHVCATKVDAVVSGIPFSFLTAQEKDDVVARTAQALKPGGVFVVYQHTTAMMKYLRRHFSDIRVEVEPINIPPYFIMICTKKQSVDRLH